MKADPNFVLEYKQVADFDRPEFPYHHLSINLDGQTLVWVSNESLRRSIRNLSDALDRRYDLLKDVSDAVLITSAIREKHALGEG